MRVAKSGCDAPLSGSEMLSGNGAAHWMMSGRAHGDEPKGTNRAHTQIFAVFCRFSPLLRKNHNVPALRLGTSPLLDLSPSRLPSSWCLAELWQDQEVDPIVRDLV